MQDVVANEVLEIVIAELDDFLVENLKVVQTHFKHSTLVQVAKDHYEVALVVSVSLRIEMEANVVVVVQKQVVVGYQVHNNEIHSHYVQDEEAAIVLEIEVKVVVVYVD